MSPSLSSPFSFPPLLPSLSSLSLVPLSSLSPPSPPSPPPPPLVRVQYLHRVKRDLDVVEDERTGLFDSQKRLIRVACRQVNRFFCAVLHIASILYSVYYSVYYLLLNALTL